MKCLSLSKYHSIFIFQFQNKFKRLILSQIDGSKESIHYTLELEENRYSDEQILALRGVPFHLEK
jgi:hypothetical protein